MSERAALCKRYNLSPLPPSVPARRLFLGGLIAEDSWTSLNIVATEAKNMFEAAVFVESTLTQSKFDRDIRFSEGSDDLARLKSLWGQTKVVVDIWRVDQIEFGDEKKFNPGPMEREQLQRQRVLSVWKRLGMKPNDVGIIADADETFTHAALLAARHCQVSVFEVSAAEEQEMRAGARRNSDMDARS